MKLTLLILVLIMLSASVLVAQDDNAIVPDPASRADSSAMTGTVGQGTETVDPDGSALYPLDPERKEKLIEYSQFRNIWRFVEFFISLGLMSLVLFTGFSAKLRDWAKVGKYKFFILWIFTILFILTDFILNLPFTIYSGFVVEQDFGFMNQTFGGWFGEQALSLGLAVVFTIIPVWFLYWLINRSKRWWAWFTVGAIPFIILMMVIVPVYVAPLTNDFEPVKNEQVRNEVHALAEKAGIGDADIFEVNGSKQSTKVNAYVTGMFSSKRIVLYDTLIDNFTIDEIRFVMGHEMGHYIMNHMWQGLAVALLFVCFALWLTNLTIHAVIRKFKRFFKFDSLGDYASLPLIMIFISIISFVFQPITNGFSRYDEHQADIYGMDITGVSGEVAATAFDKLAALNLSDPDPNPLIEFWFYSHPALNKRMEFVRNYQPKPFDRN